MNNRIEALQKEIKEIYAIFKPLIEKGLPYFWDTKNRLLKKEKYEDLIVSKRNNHSNFEDLEGNMRGEVLVAKSSDIFDLLNMERRVKLPKPVTEDYINLKILSIQMKEVMLPTRNQFKELVKMASKPIGLIPLTYESITSAGRNQCDKTFCILSFQKISIISQTHVKGFKTHVKFRSLQAKMLSHI